MFLRITFLSLISYKMLYFYTSFYAIISHEMWFGIWNWKL